MPEEKNIENPVAAQDTASINAETATETNHEAASEQHGDVVQTGAAEVCEGCATKKKCRLNPVMIAAIIVALLVAVYAGYAYYRKKHPRMIDLANQTVVTVNGVAVPRKIYALAASNVAQLVRARGLDPNDPQVRAEVDKSAMDNVINEELLVQAAKQSGMKPDEAKIKQTYDALAKRLGGEDKLATGLSKYYLSLDEFKQTIGEELMASAYIEAATNFDQMTASDDEIAAYYAKLKVAGATGQKVPDLEKIRPALEGAVKQDKEGKLAEELVNGMKAKAKIVIAK